jgi:hypothetical protein
LKNYHNSSDIDNPIFGNADNTKSFFYKRRHSQQPNKMEIPAPKLNFVTQRLYLTIIFDTKYSLNLILSFSNSGQ